MRRVVITGVGALSPCGSTAGATWDAMVAGRSGIDVLKNVPVDGLPVRIGGEVKDFDANEALGRRLAKRMDRFCQFGVVAGEEAWRDAGLENFDGDSTRMGVYIGTGVGVRETIFFSLTSSSPSTDCVSTYPLEDDAPR